MDASKALEMFEGLRQHGLGGWEILEFIDNGKSAAVFKAKRGDEFAAVKVFDHELIQKFGDAAMLERMNREKWLVGHDHRNIVRMLDSGIDKATSNHFLVMEYLQGPNLAKAIRERTLPQDLIPTFVEQLASAAEYLEERGLAHRDIKPANIVIADNMTRLVLLDFGVLLPVGEEGITDVGGTPLFVGTNQYASPEFAMRREERTPESWRAVTFYQIGAVIHDMLTGNPIFHQHTGVPARLAQAVQTEVPVVSSLSAPPYLATLAQNCLVKAPDARLTLVRWDNFKRQPVRADRSLELQERIRQRVAAAARLQSENSKHSAPAADTEEQLAHSARSIVMETLRAVGGVDPPLPRRIVYMQDQSESRVRADFEPAVGAGLPEGLSICLSVTILDPTSKVVSLQAASSPRKQEADWAPAYSPIYQGELRSELIEDAVTMALFAAVDAAQEAAIAAQPNA